MPVHTYNAAMTCGGCSGAITRILTKQLQEGEKFDVSKISVEFSFKTYHVSHMGSNGHML